MLILCSWVAPLMVGHRAFDDLLASKHHTGPLLTQQELGIYNKDWKIIYRIQRVCDQAIISNINVPVPASEITVIIQRCLRNGCKDGVIFPVHFSDDLRQVAILRCIVRIGSISPLTGKAEEYRLQTLIPEATNHSDASRGISEINFSMSKLSSDLSPEAQAYYFAKQTIEDWYQISFSPDKRYLAYVQGCGGPSKEYIFKHWNIIIFEDENFNDPEPSYRYLAQLETALCASNNTRRFTFHPHEPILVISQLAVTSLWFFAIPGTFQEQIGHQFIKRGQVPNASLYAKNRSIIWSSRLAAHIFKAQNADE